jgi:uncharacterized iron-regulated membrane protein
MGVLKLVSLLFPFVRDMLLGESSISYALKTNKRRVLLLFLLMFCLAWTAYSIPRLIEMATDQVRLEHKVQDLSDHPPGSSIADAKASATHVVSQPIETESNPVNPDKPDQPSQSPPPVNAIPNATDFKSRQQSWLTSLGDDKSR